MILFHYCDGEIAEEVDQAIENKAVGVTVTGKDGTAVFSTDFLLIFVILFEIMNLKRILNMLNSVLSLDDSDKYEEKITGNPKNALQTMMTATRLCSPPQEVTICQFYV